MAYTESQWEKAKAYYEAGMTLSQIKDKTNIARNTISQRAKREQWEHSKNSEYIEAKIKVECQKGTILEQSGSVALNIADLKPFISKAATPLIVVPPGEHTLSFNCAGCSSVSSTILAAPKTV